MPHTLSQKLFQGSYFPEIKPIWTLSIHISADPFYTGWCYLGANVLRYLGSLDGPKALMLMFRADQSFRHFENEIGTKARVFL